MRRVPHRARNDAMRERAAAAYGFNATTSPGPLSPLGRSFLSPRPACRALLSDPSAVRLSGTRGAPAD
ncbi:hypothetical protein [Streptomyces candidus]|uniref:Uncharacterized protein n=1 Tax=Streptomyces candidus TaxID=67283 RepID=A0A7X0HI83_9ACTN|nr:hypothetical protein [Streptomyces candidus]MBB6438159.1 hypothetical protein [Streptomyces candidus]GHH39085.1 hypothetical protein GCM10018773_18360 [Streptomyces candidus]